MTAFNPSHPEAIAHGPIRMLLNVDMASRVGLGDLWLPKREGLREEGAFANLH